MMDTVTKVLHSRYLFIFNKNIKQLTKDAHDVKFLDFRSIKPELNQYFVV